MLRLNELKRQKFMNSDEERTVDPENFQANRHRKNPAYGVNAKLYFTGCPK